MKTITITRDYAVMDDEVVISHIKAMVNTIVIPTILTINFGAMANGILWIVFVAVVYQIVDKPLNKQYFYMYSGFISLIAILLTVGLYVILNKQGI